MTKGATDQHKTWTIAKKDDQTTKKGNEGRGGLDDGCRPLVMMANTGRLFVWEKTNFSRKNGGKARKIAVRIGSNIEKVEK